LFQFLIEINHRKHGGWNKFEKQCQLAVQAELGKVLAQFFIDNYDTIEISLKVSLSFSYRDTVVVFAPITRVDKRLFIAGGMEVDWRDKIDATNEQMKNFVAQTTVFVVKEALRKLDVSTENFDRCLDNLSQATGTDYNQTLSVTLSDDDIAASKRDDELLKNRLAVNIALVDDHRGDEADAQLGALICQELEKLSMEKNFVLVSTACGNGYFSIEISTADPIALGDELVPWLRIMKLKDGSMINAYFRNGKFMELKRADIGRSASQSEDASQMN
jgi:hypothetical protein